jgi:hypothetical protein
VLYNRFYVCELLHNLGFSVQKRAWCPIIGMHYGTWVILSSGGGGFLEDYGLHMA